MNRSTLRAPLPRRDGMALVMALGAMVIIGGLVAGAFFISTRDIRNGRTTLSQEAAQQGVEDVLNYAREQLAVSTPTITQVGGTFTYTVRGNNATLTRLTDESYVLTASVDSGGADGTESRRRASMYMVKVVPDIEFMGALTVRGATQVGGNTYIDGTDSNPSGWACTAPGGALPGIVTPPPGNNISFSGGRADRYVEGDPPVDTASRAAEDDTYFQYGKSDWDALKESAMWVPSGTMRIQPTTLANGNCNIGDLYNWGDPLRPGGTCASYFPIIYIPGDANINGVRGQGILLVEGDLEVQGGFEFFGPVIVKGRLKTTGTGGHFTGGVMAANVEMDQNQVLGDAVVSYSACAIETALRQSAKLIPVRQRAWADLF